MKYSTGWKNFFSLFLLCMMTAIVSPGQTFTSLVSFDVTNGVQPEGALVQGTDGNFYATTVSGGSGADGTIFSITPGGALTTLYEFTFRGGIDPLSGLVLATDGSFYGTTGDGGIGYGTIFNMPPQGALTTLHEFVNSDGSFPVAALVQASGGNLYGTTETGGDLTCDPPLGCGTIFKIAESGMLTTLHIFENTDGSSPVADLLQASDGNFYGTTYYGGDLTCNAPYGCGTIFRISASGVMTTLHIFENTDGANPYAGLVRATNGSFYGTTYSGGSHAGGTIFKVTNTGALTTLYSFCKRTSCADGGGSVSGLVLATDGNLYGTTEYGGDLSCKPYGCGTIFELTLHNEFVTLHTFNSIDGANPIGTLLQATNGTFYGTTAIGGINSYGTVFSLSAGIKPFVAFVNNAAIVNHQFGILGQGFTGTSSVAVNGTSGNFTVVSDTFIKATVPAGATTGYVTVTTPGGTLTSNVPFHVLP
jgi:uncharacterized repeat protein (TIGR03803 family)